MYERLPSDKFQPVVASLNSYWKQTPMRFPSNANSSLMRRYSVSWHHPSRLSHPARLAGDHPPRRGKTIAKHENDDEKWVLTWQTRRACMGLPSPTFPAESWQWLPFPERRYLGFSRCSPTNYLHRDQLHSVSECYGFMPSTWRTGWFAKQRKYSGISYHHILHIPVHSCPLCMPSWPSLGHEYSRHLQPFEPSFQHQPHW